MSIITNTVAAAAAAVAAVGVVFGPDMAQPPAVIPVQAMIEWRVECDNVTVIEDPQRTVICALGGIPIPVVLPEPYPY